MGDCQVYPRRMEKSEEKGCSYCGVTFTPQHVILEFTSWTEGKGMLYASLVGNINVDGQDGKEWRKMGKSRNLEGLEQTNTPVRIVEYFEVCR